jgi:hypothetical protein
VASWPKEAAAATIDPSSTITPFSWEITSADMAFAGAAAGTAGDDEEVAGVVVDVGVGVGVGVGVVVGVYAGVGVGVCVVVVVGAGVVMVVATTSACAGVFELPKFHVP